MNINRDKHNKYVVNGVYGPSTSGSTDTGGSTGSSSSTSSGSNTGSSSSGIGGGNYGGNGGGSSVISVLKNAFTIFLTSDGVNTIVQTATSEESTASIDFAGDDVIKVTIAAQSSIPESEFTSITGESVYKISYGKQTVEEETLWVLELEYVSGTQLKPSDFDALKLFSVESEEEGSFSEVASFPSSELTIETITKEVSVGVTEDRVTKISVDCDLLLFTQVSLTLTVEDTYSTVLSFNTSISNKTITQFIADLSDYATKVYVQEQIDALVGAAPDILDTLYELANALGNDPNFATTITNMITGIDNRVDVVEADIETLKEQLGNISVDDAIANYLTTNNYAKKSDITWGNLLDKPSVFNTNIANISDLHSSWDALLKVQKPTTLAGYGITDGVNAVSVTGSGNVVTSASVSGHVLTLTKGVNALTSVSLATISDLHSSWGVVLKAQKPAWLTTVSLATISDLHASWDALLKAAPSAYVTRWPTAAEVGALTQSAGDGRYALKGGSNATGTWPISITENAATATKLALQDTRRVNTAPFAYGNGLVYLFKYNTADGLNDGGTYHSVLQFDQWGESSGGLCKQLALTDGGNMWFRNASSATAWGAWKKLLDSSNYTSIIGNSFVKKAGDTMTGALTVPSLAVSGSTATVSGNKVWHAGNDGSGSGLDADLLDGLHNGNLTAAYTHNGAIRTNRVITKNDHYGWPVYILIADCTSTINVTSNGTHYGFTGFIIEKRTGGVIKEVVSKVIARIGWNNTRRALQSDNASTIPYIIKNGSTYYLAIRVAGSGHEVYFHGYEINLLPTFAQVNSTDSSGTLPSGYSIYATGIGMGVYGNSTSATQLQTARTINGTAFNGTSNIVTSYWGTSRTLSLTGNATGSVSMNGSANVSMSVNVNYATSAGNADTLDGYHGSSYLRSFWTNQPGYDANTYPWNSFCTFTYSRNAPYTGVLAYLGVNGYGMYLNLAYTTGTSTGRIAYRKVSPSNDGGGLGGWAYLARTTDNVASATKLQTAQTIWGQSFNGTAPVSGDMTGVGSISANGKIISSSGFATAKPNASCVYLSNEYYAGGSIIAGGNSSEYGGDYIAITPPSTSAIKIQGFIICLQGSYRVRINGNVLVSGSVNESSDIRVKTNIADLTYRGRLNPKSYIKDLELRIGFIAQDVLKLYPEVVTEDSGNDHLLSLNYGNITAILSALINYVEDEVSLLKKKIQELETRLSKYEDVK